MINEINVEIDDPQSVYINMPYGHMTIHVDKTTGKAEINIQTHGQIGIDYPFIDQCTVHVFKKETVEVTK